MGTGTVIHIFGIPLSLDGLAAAAAVGVLCLYFAAVDAAAQIYRRRQARYVGRRRRWWDRLP